MASTGGIGGGGGGQYIWISPIQPRRIQSVQLLARLKKLRLSQPTTVRPKGLAYPRFNVLLNQRLARLNTPPPFKLKPPHSTHPQNLLWRLIPLIQPPAAKLGVPPRIIFQARMHLQGQRWRINQLALPIVRRIPPHNAEFRLADKVVPYRIGPNVSQLGLRPAEIFAARYALRGNQWRQNFLARPVWKRSVAKSLLDRVIRMTAPTVVRADLLPPRKLKRQQAVAAKRLATASVRTKAIRAVAPVGLPPKKLKRQQARIAVASIRRGPPRTLADRLVRLASSGIVPVGSPTTGIVSGGNLTINVPAGVQNGDVLLFGVAGGSTPTAPAALTTVPGGNASYSAQNLFYFTYYRIASSEPASYTFTGPTFGSGICLAFRGVNQSNPIDQVAVTNNGATSSPAAPALASLNSSVDMLTSWWGLGGGTPTIPADETGTTIVYSSGVNWGNGAGYKLLAANSSGTETMGGGALAVWAAVSIALLPSGFQPGVPQTLTPKRLFRKGAVVKVVIPPRPKPLRPIDRLVRLIQPPAAALGFVPKRIFKRGAVVRVVVAPRPKALRPVARLQPRIGPNVAQLGLPPKLFRRTRPPIKLNFGKPLPPLKPLKRIQRFASVIIPSILPVGGADKIWINPLYRRTPPRTLRNRLPIIGVSSRADLGAAWLGQRKLRKYRPPIVLSFGKPLPPLKPLKRAIRYALPTPVEEGGAYAGYRRHRPRRPIVIRQIPQPKPLLFLRNRLRFVAVVQPPIINRIITYAYMPLKIAPISRTAASLGVSPKRFQRKGAIVQVRMARRARAIDPLQRILRASQPSVAELGGTYAGYRKHKPKGTIARVVIAPRPKPVRILRRTIQPPASALGVPPKRILRRGARVPFVLAARPAAVRLTKRITRLVQPPIIAPPPRSVYRHRGAVVRVVIAPRPKPIRPVWRRRLIVRGADTLGFPPKRILRKGAVVRVRIARRPKALNPILRVAHIVQPPSIPPPPRYVYRRKGAVVRVRIAPRPKAIDSVQRLVRFAQPSAAYLGGVWAGERRHKAKGVVVKVNIAANPKAIQPIRRIRRFPQPIVQPPPLKVLRRKPAKPIPPIKLPKALLLTKRVVRFGRPQPPRFEPTPRQLKRRGRQQYPVIRQPTRRNALARLRGLLIPKPPPLPPRLQLNLEIVPLGTAPTLTVEVLGIYSQLGIEVLGAVQSLTVEVLQVSSATSL